jgi:hypothetical protein
MWRNYTTWSLRITLGGTTIDVLLIGFLAVKLIFLLAGILFVVQGFRVHWGWGLANLLLPPAIIVFFVKHRQAAKFPAIVWGVGMGLLVLLLVCASC